jgi:glycosyltransferase involved in cell wall biosynthesis/1-acyl-sn-glycerol-3-phosphate acyltransferase
MKILFVIDDYGTASNGTVMAAKRMEAELIRQGHTVRICSSGAEGENVFPLKRRWIPFVSFLAKKQGKYFAKPDKKVLAAAIKDIDVVHAFEPWKLERTAQKMCKKQGIAFTASFHIHPDNIMLNVPLLNWGIIGLIFRKLVIWKWRKFYSQYNNIHCPSQFAMDTVCKARYRSTPMVVSNGIPADFVPIKNKQVKDISACGGNDFFVISATGRYAVEKRQEIAIKAVALSRYRDKILLQMAGHGPRRKYYDKLAKKLGINYELNDFLLDIKTFLRSSDLYLHTAEVEIEGLSCIEAIACGIVPIIANSKKSATPQFAIDDRNLFELNNPKDLAQKIDYLIEHHDERTELTNRYIEESKYYKIEYTIQKMIEMFKKAIFDKKTELEAAKTRRGKRMRKKIKYGIIYNFFSYFMFYVIALPVLSIINKLFFGLQIKGKRNIRSIIRKHLGAVTIINHVHNLDSEIATFATLPKKPIYTSLPSNFNLPIAGNLVNILGAVPIPVTPSENRVFFYELERKLRAGKFVHFFPEGELIPYDMKLRPFRRGAFNLAVKANVPVIPMMIVYRERKAKNKKPKFTVIVGKPIYPDNKLFYAEMCEKLQTECHTAMEELSDSFVAE